MRKTLTYILSASVVALLSVSCENAKFLDQYPYSQTSPENFYNSPESMRMALISCYEIINTNKIPGAGNMQRGSYAQGLLYIMNTPSDDMVASSSSSNEGLEMMWANYNESTQCVRDFWKVQYAGINRCNTLLHYIEDIDMDPALKEQYKAEACFLRAFYYYHLAWNFGGVPIVLSHESNGQEPRATLEKVYEQIFEDLDYAYTTLNTTGVFQTSSANKYTAAAYIARICNYLAACKNNNAGAGLEGEGNLNSFAFVDADAMYKRSKEVCEDIIRNSSYTLIPDYTNLFRETTKAQQYQECLFLAELPLSGSEGYWPNSFYLPSPTCNADSPTVWGGRFVPTPRAFYMYSKNDPRRDHNLTGRMQDVHPDGHMGKTEIQVDGYTYYNPDPPRTEVNELDASGNPIKDESSATGYKQIESPLYDSPTQTYLATAGIQVCPGKYRLCGIDQLQRTYNQHAISFPLMRLADVYLMYAEAVYFADGDEGTAREYLRKVLLRACGNDSELCDRLMTEYRRDNFTDELLESRERELIFECSRKWDLIRFNQIDQKISSLNKDGVDRADIERVLGKDVADTIHDNYLLFPSDAYLKIGIPTLVGNWESYKIWLPISEEQRGVNKSLTQNHGW